MNFLPSKLHRSTILSLLIIFVGFIFLMLPAIPYGSQEQCVLGKCGIFFADIYRARDDLWHMALAQVAFDTSPFRMPIFAGAYLQNYHFLYSFILGLVTKLGISVNAGYYVVLPIAWFAAYTFLTVRISEKLTSDRRAIPFFLFFSYFSSGFAFLLSLKNTGSFIHNIGWFSNQPGEYLINPTLALSLIFFQLLLLILLDGIRSVRKVIVCLVIMFLLWGSKFYAGVIGISFISIYLVASVFRKKTLVKQSIWILSGVCIVSICAVIVFYNPFNTIGKGGVFNIEPFKTIHPMIEDPELFPLLRVARIRYLLADRPILFWPILVIIEEMTLILYVIFAYGTRILSIGLAFMKEKLSPFLLALFGSSIIATVLPALLTQKGGDWFNTIQFMAYSQFLLQISLAIFVFKLYVQKSRNTRIAVIVVLCITLLGALNPVFEYGRHFPIVSNFISPKLFQPRVYVSTEELRALAFLKGLEQGTVFTFPFTPIFDTATVKQLWKTNDTALVAALGDKQLYAANLEQLDLMSIEHSTRTFELKDLNKINIAKLPVRYFYLQKEYPGYASFTKRLKPYAKIIFENKEVTVWEKN